MFRVKTTDFEKLWITQKNKREKNGVPLPENKEFNGKLNFVKLLNVWHGDLATTKKAKQKALYGMDIVDWREGYEIVPSIP